MDKELKEKKKVYIFNFYFTKKIISVIYFFKFRN